MVGIQILHFIHCSYLMSANYIPGVVPFIGDGEQKKLPSLSLEGFCLMSWFHALTSETKTFIAVSFLCV